MMSDTRIWAIADIHGSYLPIENFWCRNKDNITFSQDRDILICLGDFGGNFFFNKRDKEFKERLKDYNLTYFVIRGNHEQRPSICAENDPDSWHTEEFFENTVYVENDFPYIKYALDEPTVYQIPYKIEIKEKMETNILFTIEVYNYKTLVIPGAYSVDKYYRLKKHWSWFENEQLSEQEMESGRRILQENEYNFDLILSHTCPITYEPTDLFLSQVDQSTVDKTMERYLGEIEYYTNYKLWLWGHYHSYRVYPPYENKQCIMLSDGKEVINVQEWLNDSKNIHQTY